MPRWSVRASIIAIACVLAVGFVYVILGAGQRVANAASYVGGVFALTAMWLYLKPRAICSVELYEYVPGTGTARTFRLSVKNPGNVPITLKRFTAQFQSDAGSADHADYARLFEGKVLEPGAEFPVWLNETEMRQRTGFAVVYRGWFRGDFETRCSIGPFGVTFVMSAMAAGTATLTARATVVRASAPEQQDQPEREDSERREGG